MANPKIVWDFGRQSIDLSARGIARLRGGPTFRGARVQSGAVETTVLDLFERLDITIGPEDDATLFRSLKAWEAAALAGQPFDFALDGALAGSTFLNGDLTAIEKLTNGRLEAWDTASPSRPDGYTVTENGTTTFRRETRRARVAEGIYSGEWAIDATPSQTTVQLPDSDSVAASFSMKLSYLLAAEAGPTEVEVRIQNLTTSNYLQANGTWGAGQVWISSKATPAPGGKLTLGPSFGTATHTFTNDSSAGALRITFRNSAEAGGASKSVWIDDIRLNNQATSVTVWDGGPFAGGEQVVFRNRASLRFERISLSNATATSLTLASAGLIHDYRDGDLVTHEGFYPHMKLERPDPVLEELPGGTLVWQARIRARMAETGAN